MSAIWKSFDTEEINMVNGYKAVWGLCLGIICFFGGDSAAGELKFVTQEFAPFHYSEGKNVAGPGAEIVRLVCGKMNANCSIRSYPWTRAQKMVREGKANAMFLIGKNKTREEWLWFSHPILQTEYGFFVQKDNPLQFKKADDVKGLKVAVFGPSNTSKSLDKIKLEIKDLIIDMTVNDEPGFRKLPRGRVDAVYSNKDVGFALISRLELKGIRYAGMHRELEYFVGFSKQYNDRQTVDAFNEAFMELYKSGTVLEILDRYKMNSSKIE